jgi:hypothetical protein
MMILQRQARDKHSENSKKARLFCCSLIAVGTSRSSSNLRMAGNLQLCVAVLLGAAAPGVSPVCLPLHGDLCAGAGTTLECLNATRVNNSSSSFSCVWLATEMACRAADMDVCEDHFLHGRAACLHAGECEYDEGNSVLRSVLVLVGSCCSLGWAVVFCASGCCCNFTLSQTTAGEIRPSTVMRSIPTVKDHHRCETKTVFSSAALFL